jgi:hypothetical protein
VKQLRNKLTVGATLLSLGGLTGVAMSAGGRKSDPGTAPAADVQTVTTQQTIRRYRHIGAGGSSNGTWAQSGAVFAAAHASGTTVRTRASGAKTTYAKATGGWIPAVKSGPSGIHHTASGKRYATSAPGASPTTHPSGAKGGGGKGMPVASNPATKPSGSSASASATTPTTPSAPTTKASGAPAGGETAGGGGTPTTPAPPSTKPSGSTGGGEPKGKGEPEGKGKGEGEGESGGHGDN